jgi:hypothetical protein
MKEENAVKNIAFFIASFYVLHFALGIALLTLAAVMLVVLVLMPFIMGWIYSSFLFFIHREVIKIPEKDRSSWRSVHFWGMVLASYLTIFIVLLFPSFVINYNISDYNVNKMTIFLSLMSLLPHLIMSYNLLNEKK